MIRLLKDYYDKNGIRYKIMSFNGSKYACQSYHDGKCIYLDSNELFASPPPKPVKTKFTDMVKKDVAEDKKTFLRKITMPVYEEENDCKEPIQEKKSEEEQEVQKPIPLKDNKEEKAADDFYADF